MSFTSVETLNKTIKIKIFIKYDLEIIGLTVNGDV